MKVIDKATGEYIEIQYEGIQDFATQWDELNQRIAALERLKKKMSAEAISILEGEEIKEVGNGWTIKMVTQSRKSYGAKATAKILHDADLDPWKYLKVNKTKLDADIAESVEDGGPLGRVGGDLQRTLEVDTVVTFPRLFK